jgi:hypothetical protein
MKKPLLKAGNTAQNRLYYRIVVLHEKRPAEWQSGYQISGLEVGKSVASSSGKPSKSVPAGEGKRSTKLPDSIKRSRGALYFRRFIPYTHLDIPLAAVTRWKDVQTSMSKSNRL